MTFGWEATQTLRRDIDVDVYDQMEVYGGMEGWGDGGMELCVDGGMDRGRSKDVVICVQALLLFFCFAL